MSRQSHQYKREARLLKRLAAIVIGGWAIFEIIIHIAVP